MLSCYKVLIGSFSFLLLLANVVAAAANSQSFFIDVQLSDSYTGSTNCTDYDHWFLVEADIFVPQGVNEDIYLTVPEEFTSFPNNSFPVRANSQIVGSVTSGLSNKLKISYDNAPSVNTTASINFLVQLTDDAKKQITSPGLQNYAFNVSTGSSFNRSINYVAKDVGVLTSNGGIYAENNTAWFTADIPLSMLDRAVTFTSSGKTNSSYMFNTSLTSVEVVVGVDAFNQPLRSFPFTAVEDKSDSSQIQLLFNSKIDGGKYLRVNYYSQPLKTNTIANTISLNFANGLSKRDSTLTLSSNLYAGSQANIENQGSAGDTSSTIPAIISASSTSNEAYETYYLETTTSPGVYTEIGTWLPISTLSTTQTSSAISQTSSDSGENSSSDFSSDSSVLSSSAVIESSDSLASTSASLASTSTSITGVSPISATTYDSSKSISSFHYSNATSSTTIASADKVEEAGLFGVKANASEGYTTYSLITLTLNGELVTFTSLFPISTVSELPSTQGFYVNSTSTSLLSTATVFSTLSDSASMTLSPESTISTATQVTPSTTSEKSSSTSTSLESDKSFSNVTRSLRGVTQTLISSAIENYQTYALVTKEEGAIETSYISLRAISTIDPAYTTINESNAGTSTVVESSSYSSDVTKAKIGSDFSTTSASELSSSYKTTRATTTKDLPADPVFTSATISDTRSSIASIATTGESSFSSVVSSSTGSSNSSMTRTTKYSGTLSSNSDLSSLVIQTQLTSAEDSLTSLIMTMYEGRANRALKGITGLAGFSISFILFWV